MYDRPVRDRSRFAFARIAVLGAVAAASLLGAKGCDSGAIGVQNYGSIAGNTVDGKGRPLANAIVYVGSLATVRSDPQGAFVLPHVPEGEQMLGASLGGYRTGSATVIVIKEKQVSAGNVVLTQLTANP